MDRQRIKLLSDLLPAPSYLREPSEDEGVMAKREFEAAKFAHYYKDLSFGFNMVRLSIKHDLDIPAQIRGDDHWIMRLYLYLTLDHDDPVMDMVYMLGTSMPEDMTRSVVESLLLCVDASYEDIAQRTGLYVQDGLSDVPSSDVIQAYEKLFFNVRDRHEETLWLGSIIYPSGRMVEMKDDYAYTETLGNLMRRAGYNNGMDDVQYLAGLRSGLLNEVGSIAPHLLESTIMANGYLMAKNGFINTDNKAVSQARSLIAAAKAGGTESAEVDEMSSLGAIMKGEFVRHKLAEAEQQRNVRRGLEDVITLEDD